MPVTTSDSMKPETVNGRVQTPAQETVVPEPKQVSKDEVELELFYEFVNNFTQAEAAALGIALDGQGRAVFGPGKVTVPADIAADLARRQAACIKADHDRLNGTDRSSGQIANIR